MICNRCLHGDVCEFANAKINSDTRVKDIEFNLAFSNCMNFIDKNNFGKSGDWISVKDRLPEHGNYVLFFGDGNGGECFVGYYSEFGNSLYH